LELLIKILVSDPAPDWLRETEILILWRDFEQSIQCHFIFKFQLSFSYFEQSSFNLNAMSIAQNFKEIKLQCIKAADQLNLRVSHSVSVTVGVSVTVMGVTYTVSVSVTVTVSVTLSVTFGLTSNQSECKCYCWHTDVWPDGNAHIQFHTLTYTVIH